MDEARYEPWHAGKGCPKDDKGKGKEKTCSTSLAKSSDEPEAPEISSFFKDFTNATPEQKAARWQAIKREQKEFMATWKKSAKAQGDLGRGHAGSSSDHLKRVPTPPPPPPKPIGTRPKAAPNLQL